MISEKVPARSEYDYDTDTFFARPMKRTYSSSFQTGNIIFDIDENDKIVGLELLNASKVFNLPKISLKNPKDMMIRIIVSETSIEVDISIRVSRRNSESTSSLSIERVKPDFLRPSEMDLAFT